MSRIDDAVKTFLIPLITGAAGVVDQKAQVALTSWVVMKCMVMEADDPAEAVSKKYERELFMNTGEPPYGWRVWIAQQLGKRWRIGLNRAAVALSFTPNSAEKGTITFPPNMDFAKNTQSITFGIGHALFHATFSRLPSLMNVDPSPAMAPFLRRIWPHEAGFVWPSGHVISDEQIFALTEALPDFAKRDKWRPIPDWAPLVTRP